jgi:hypothetical protein
MSIVVALSLLILFATVNVCVYYTLIETGNAFVDRIDDFRSRLESSAAMQVAIVLLGALPGFATALSLDSNSNFVAFGWAVLAVVMTSALLGSYAFIQIEPSIASPGSLELAAFLDNASAIIVGVCSAIFSGIAGLKSMRGG